MLALILVATPRARADVFDVAKDFSIGSNPNGVWSYGYSTTLTGPLTLNAESLTISGVEFWRTNLSLGAPASFYNPTSSVVAITSDLLQPNQFGFHPGPADQFEKARLTVPTAGTYSITGAFSGTDTGGTTTDVHILLNGVSIFDGAVNGFGPSSGPSFSLTRALGVNDTLDFAVGFGSDGNFFADGTGLAAQIALASVPEPSPLVLAGLGMLLIGGISVARRRPSSVL
jgi:hypothetical protein